MGNERFLSEGRKIEIAKQIEEKVAKKMRKKDLLDEVRSLVLEVGQIASKLPDLSANSDWANVSGDDDLIACWSHAQDLLDALSDVYKRLGGKKL